MQAYRITVKAAIMASRKENGEIDEEKFYDSKLKIVKKVAELWELSPVMEQHLIQRWVEEKVKLKPGVELEDNYFGWGGLFSDRQKTTALT